MTNTKSVATQECVRPTSPSSESYLSPTETTPILSKNQQKKEERLQRVEANKLRKRRLEKDRQKERVRESRKEGAPSKRDIKTHQISNLRQSLVSGTKICVDLQFDEVMSDKELVHLAAQLRRVYSSNKAAQQPFHLYFANFDKNGRSFKTCCDKNMGFQDYIVDMDSTGPLDLFDKDSLVYLTPNSEEVLDVVADDKVYVIGGLCDDSVKKDQTAGYAKSLGIKTARLPIKGYMLRASGGNFKQILTINQVFDILLKWKESKDWSKALAVGVPQRTGFYTNAE